MTTNPQLSTEQSGEQSESLGAVVSLAAVINEISKAPQKSLTKPIGQWLPWLEEEGYSGTDFVSLLNSLENQEHQVQHLEALISSYYEDSRAGRSTLNFLLKFKHQNPKLFRHCFIEYTNKLKCLRETNSLAGGKLTGPTATFIKHKPLISSELLAIGLATTWLLVEKKLESNAEKSLKAAIAKQAIKNAVDDEESEGEQRLYRDSQSGSLDITNNIENLENNPVKYLELQQAKIASLKNKLLTPENADKFVQLAFKDEEGAIFTEAEDQLLNEVRGGRNLWEWADEPENEDVGRIERFYGYWKDSYQLAVDNLGKDQAEDFFLNHELPFNDQGVLVPMELPERLRKIMFSGDNFDWISKEAGYMRRTMKWINELKTTAFTRAYQEFIENGTPQDLDKAAEALLVEDVKNNARIDLGYQSAISNLDNDVIQEESVVLQDIFADAASDAEVLLESELSNVSDDLLAKFINYLDNADEEINSFIDNRV